MHKLLMLRGSQEGSRASPDSNGNGQLKVVAGRRERLRDGALIAAAKPLAHGKGAEEHEPKVQHHGHRHAADIPDVADDLRDQRCQQTMFWSLCLLSA